MRYLTTKEVAKELGVESGWVISAVYNGWLPRRRFGNQWALTADDIPLARAVLDTPMSERVSNMSEPERVAYSLSEAVELTGVGERTVLALIKRGYVPASQKFGTRNWMIFEDGLQQIKDAPPLTRRVGADYRSKRGRTVAVPPLNERQRYVVEQRHTGRTLADIARELGVKRERTSAIYASARTRARILFERIGNIADAASALGVDEETFRKLAEITEVKPSRTENADD